MLFARYGVQILYYSFTHNTKLFRFIMVYRVNRNMLQTVYVLTVEHDALKIYHLFTGIHIRFQIQY